MTQTSTYRADNGDTLTLTYPEGYSDPLASRRLLNPRGDSVWFDMVTPVTEPTGLGAVVEAKVGGFLVSLPFVRTQDGWWMDPDGDQWRWSELEDPTVLSPGYDG